MTGTGAGARVGAMAGAISTEPGNPLKFTAKMLKAESRRDPGSLTWYGKRHVVFCICNPSEEATGQVG